MSWARHWLTALVALAILALVIGWQLRSTEPPDQAELDLPDAPPDLFIRTFQQTRFDAEGRPSLYTVAASLAFYEDRGESLVRDPTVRLVGTSGADWNIRSSRATLHDNGDVVFEDDVRVRELSGAQPWRLTTEWLRVEDDGAFVTTPRPVRLTQGPQVATGVGMDADLTAADPVLTLKSEVAIRYEAD